MNIYFSGIGGVGLGSLAQLAQDAGHHVQGSDITESLTTHELGERGIVVNMKQNGGFLQTVHSINPVDLFVYTAALPADHPEIEMAKKLGIKAVKRDDLLLQIIADKNLKLIAISGTHGKTTTTAMMIWAFRQLGVPVSYSLGTTISFGASGQYEEDSEYFIYECDEFDKNFLAFHPYTSIITSIEYDHPDSYGSPENYMEAFEQFLDQSEYSIMWRSNGILVHANETKALLLPDNEIEKVSLAGEHNRRNATLVLKTLEKIGIPGDHLSAINSFPGSDRRFEQLAPNLYSDYGHHPTEIAATLQMARELNDHIVLVYQPHQNTRQHEIRPLYENCFELAEEIYWLPTYLTRENPALPILPPEELIENISNRDSVHIVGQKDDLWGSIQRARANDKLVLVMGAGSIDAWLRDKVKTVQTVNIILIDQDGNFVMHHQPGQDENGVMTISGHIKQDDVSIIAAASRSIHEKTNLVINEANLSYFRTYTRALDDEDDEKELVTYMVLKDISTEGLDFGDNTLPVIVNADRYDSYTMPTLDRAAIEEYVNQK